MHSKLSTMIVKGYEVKSVYKTVHGIKSAGNQAQASKNPLSVKSYTTCRIPPAMSDSICEVLSTREADWRRKAPGVLESGHVGTFFLACIKIPDSQMASRCT